MSFLENELVHIFPTLIIAGFLWSKYQNWLLGRWIGITGLEWTVSFAYFFHLLWENFGAKYHPLAYFFTHRLLNNFSLESFDNLIESN